MLFSADETEFDDVINRDLFTIAPPFLGLGDSDTLYEDILTGGRFQSEVL